MAKPGSLDQSNHPTAYSPSAFAALNSDVLLCIVSHLDVLSLTRLGQTNGHLFRFVEEHGWKGWCVDRGIRLYREASIPIQTTRRVAVTSNSILDVLSPYRALLRADRSWEKKEFRSFQSPLPLDINSKGKVDRNRPRPILLLTKKGLFLFTGSVMRFWSKDVLQTFQSVCLDDAQVFYLSNPAGLEKKSGDESGGGGLGGSSALWDICACAQLDAKDRYIAIGRLNGLVEIIKISSAGKKGRRKGEGEGGGGRVVINLVWYWKDMARATSIQSMHASPSSGILAVAGKKGNIALFHTGVKGGNIQVDLIEHWNIGSRPWSIWVEEAKWLAVGSEGLEPVILYPLHSHTYKPGKSIRLLTSAKPKSTSVYALNTNRSSGKAVLLAGCYDGTLRLYDVEAAFRGSTKATLAPLSLHSDRFDPSAIYCLTTDVGINGQMVAAGTARHGVCRFFQTAPTAQREEEEEESWSMFGTESSQSPTYSLAGQFNRLFGVTDAVFWQVDVRPVPPTFSLSKDSRGQRDVKAYYRHGEMIIDHTRWPASF
jgi:WD40 repeat protein